MNEVAYTAASRLVPTSTAIQQGRDARKTHERHIRVLLEQVTVLTGVENIEFITMHLHACIQKRKLPQDGWSDLRIELLLQELAVMDSNNFPG